MRRVARMWCALALAVLSLALGLRGCGASQPSLVLGPPVRGSSRVWLEFSLPGTDLTINKGEAFTIRWVDSDPDASARISFTLVDTETGAISILLVSNIEEDDDKAPDEFSVSTALIPTGSYHLRADLVDDVNQPLSIYALVQGSSNRVVVTVAEAGTVPANSPPQVATLEPRYNVSLIQNQILLIETAPTADFLDTDTNAEPYDRDSQAMLYIVLDRDRNPDNDDPRLPDYNSDPSNGIILLDQELIPLGLADTNAFAIQINIDEVPAREDGRPYYVRATIIDDSGNVPVHSYAKGTVNIVRAATGTVDLSQVGKTLGGVRFIGFNPGASLGSTLGGVKDFDGDGVDDFVLIAQFGVTRNLGNMGEAYLVWGQPQTQFGGEINVNTVSADVPGAILEAPDVNGASHDPLPGQVSPPLSNRLNGVNRITTAKTLGITSLGSIDDLGGDGRPEIILGLPHVEGIRQTRDDDPVDGGGGDVGDTETITITFQPPQVVATRFNPTLGTSTEFFRSSYGEEFVDDVWIDRDDPARSFDSELEWLSDNAGRRKMALLEFEDVLTFLSNVSGAGGIGAITIVDARLSVRVFQTGVDGFVFELFPQWGFNDSPDIDNDPIISYRSFGLFGPQAGTDFNATALDFFQGSQDQIVNANVTAVLQGMLTTSQNDALFMVLPAAPAGASTIIHDHEFATVTDRPQLRITFDRPAEVSPNYPDCFVNNATTAEDGVFDYHWEALGCAIMLDSTNLDNDFSPTIGPTATTRLADTVVSLELVGQAAGISEIYVDPEGTLIEQLADATEGGRISGCRFQAGMYDQEDAFDLDQPPLFDYFGWQVASMPDLNDDQIPELIFSAPYNEQDHQDIYEQYEVPTGCSSHYQSRAFLGSIVILTGSGGYFDDSWRHEAGAGGASCVPNIFDENGPCRGQPASLTPPVPRNMPYRPRTCDRSGDATTDIEVFAESKTDWLHDGSHAGDVNRDGVPDILCGAPLNDFDDIEDTGAMYILYGRIPMGDYYLATADSGETRPPMLRIRGQQAGDQIGWKQVRIADINGDGMDDIVLASPRADYAGIRPQSCSGDFDGNGFVDDADLALFDQCASNFRDDVHFEGDSRQPFDAEVFVGDSCKVFDYNNDRRLDNRDRDVLACLYDGGDDNCCPADNGLVAIVFGSISLDGDRTISQIATPDLPGVLFYGAQAGHLVGWDIASAGDFNGDGYNDLLISAPGVSQAVEGSSTRLGVVYLIFGGTHLNGNLNFSLAQVGSATLPGMILVSPFATGRPDEAPVQSVAGLGDINDDGFDDIGVGIPRADFLDETRPQYPNQPGTDPNVGRRTDDGSVYIIYGNSTGQNR